MAVSEPPVVNMPVKFSALVAVKYLEVTPNRTTDTRYGRGRSCRG